MAQSASEHANTNTPYGRVVQQIDLPVPDLPQWEYCNPLAYMYHVSTLSDDFCRVMTDCLQPQEPAHIILYIDEVVPGNPFRPKRSRTIQCIYWMVEQWPEWLIGRSAAWPILGVLRSTFLDSYPGGISGFFAKILRIMFMDENSFAQSVIITRREGPQLLLRGEYHGTIADEKALKEIHGYKGASGSSVSGP